MIVIPAKACDRHPRESGDPEFIYLLDFRLRGNDGEVDFRLRGNDGEVDFRLRGNDGEVDFRLRGNDDGVDFRFRGNDKIKTQILRWFLWRFY